MNQFRKVQPSSWSDPRRRGKACLRRSCAGIATLEFALIAPLLLTMMAGLYDVTMAFIAWQRVTMAAQAIDEIATSLAATATNTNTLNAAQATTASSAIYAYLPGISLPLPPAFGVTLTSVVMTPIVQGCVTGCTYTAHVAWSGVFQGAGPVRPCDSVSGVSALTATGDDLDPSPSTLPVDTYGASPLLVADVTYTFTPLFFTFLTGPMTMTRTAFFSTRTGRVSDWIHYVEPTGAGLRCSGYPA
jgi:Flp pilus assembly protein TadG